MTTDQLKAMVAEKGGRLTTVRELHATREDFSPLSPGLMRVFRGPITAGTRIALGGGPATGKSSTAKRMVETLRRVFPDRRVIIGDFELAEEGDTDRADVNRWALDDDMINIVQWSTSGEGFYDMICDIIRKGVPISGIVFDSLHAMSPRSQQENDLDRGGQMASQASMLSTVLKKSTGLLGVCNVTQFWILQKRNDPGKMGAQYQKIGNALGHFADVNLTFNGGVETKGSRIYDADDRLIGGISTVTVAKKKKGHLVPFSETDMYITFDGGIDDGMNLAASIDELIERSGQILTIPLPVDLKDEIHGGVEDAGFEPSKETFEWNKDGDLVIRGGGKSSLINRVICLANMTDAIPPLNKYLTSLFLDQFPKPRREVYPGAYEYPSGKALEVLIAELDATSGDIGDAE